MLTQIQTIERQVALLAACPRPRALAFVPASSVITTSVVTQPVIAQSVIASPLTVHSVPTANPLSTEPVTTTVSAASVPSFAWSHVTPISAAAFARVPGFGATTGYAEFELRPMAEVRMDAAVRRNGEGRFGLNRENGTTSSKQQDQKHLTARREPVTWRPPH
jgi:hypothetical protein